MVVIELRAAVRSTALAKLGDRILVEDADDKLERAREEV